VRPLRFEIGWGLGEWFVTQRARPGWWERGGGDSLEFREFSKKLSIAKIKNILF